MSWRSSENLTSHVERVFPKSYATVWINEVKLHQKSSFNIATMVDWRTWEFYTKLFRSKPGSQSSLALFFNKPNNNGYIGSMKKRRRTRNVENSLPQALFLTLPPHLPPAFSSHGQGTKAEYGGWQKVHRIFKQTGFAKQFACRCFNLLGNLAITALKVWPWTQ